MKIESQNLVKNIVSTSISQSVKIAKEQKFYDGSSMFDGTVRINETINGIVADSIFHVLNNDMKMDVEEIIHLDAGDSEDENFDIFTSGNSCMSIEIEEIHIVLNNERVELFKEKITKFDYLSVEVQTVNEFFGDVDGEQSVITVSIDTKRLEPYLTSEYKGLMVTDDFEIEVA